MVRVSYFNGDEFGGCTDLPDSCSRRMVIHNYVSRGYFKIDLPFEDKKIRMINLWGYLVIIEEVMSIVVETEKVG